MFFESCEEYGFCNDILIENVIKGLIENKEKKEITIKLKYCDIMYGGIDILKMEQLGMGIIGPCSIEFCRNHLKMEYNLIYKKLKE